MEKDATSKLTKKELLLGIYFTFSLMIVCVEVISDSFLVFIGYYTIALLNLGNCVRVINAHEKKQKKNGNTIAGNRT